MKWITFVESVLAKLKLTGAAALALAFILVMTGCPNGPEPEPADTVVSATDLTSLVRRPVSGAEPQYSIPAQPQYIPEIQWRTGTDGAVYGNFAASTVYKAVITLTAKPGFTFQGISASVFRHIDAVDIHYYPDTGIVVITFPATDSNEEGRLVISGTLSEDGGLVTPGSSRKFRGVVQDDNRIAGKLQDGTRVFKLEGLYDQATSVFTMQAASSDIVFSISGELDAGCLTEASHASVHHRVGGEWATAPLDITPGEQTVENDVNQTSDATLPAWGKGIWYDQMSGQSVKFIVTDNSITYIFTWSYNSIQHSIVRDIAVVEIEPVSPGAVNLIVRAPRFGYNPATGGIINERIYTARFYCTNSFDTKLNDAIGNTTLASLGIGGMAGVTVAQAASMLGSGDKVFIAPYCSDSEPKILDGETDDWGYSPRFVGESATAHAKAAAVLRAFEGETFALMHTPGQMHTPDQSGRQIVIDMYDSAGDGWDHSGALSITINGVNISNARLSSGSSGRYTFSTDAGDAVNMYWTGNSGSYHGENAFVVYYADTPPVPAFNSVSWSGSNALLFRLTDSLSNADLNQHLGSF